MIIKRKNVKADFFSSFHVHFSIDIRLGARQAKDDEVKISMYAQIYISRKRKMSKR